MTVPALYVAFQFIAYQRLGTFLAELELFFADGTLTADSFGWRYELATSGLRAFLDNPLIGHGLHEHMGAAFAHASAGGPDITFISHLHNDFIAHLVAYGIAGLLFVFAFLGMVWIVAVRCADRGARRAGITVTFMLILYMMFDILFHMDAMTGALTVAMGILLLTPWSRRGGEATAS